MSGFSSKHGQCKGHLQEPGGVGRGSRPTGGRGRKPQAGQAGVQRRDAASGQTVLLKSGPGEARRELQQEGWHRAGEEHAEFPECRGKARKGFHGRAGGSLCFWPPYGEGPGVKQNESEPQHQPEACTRQGPATRRKAGRRTECHGPNGGDRDHGRLPHLWLKQPAGRREGSRVPQVGRHPSAASGSLS